MSNLLFDSILEIQNEYCDLLKEQLPLLELDKDVRIALDCVALFWRRKRKIVEAFLKYFVKTRETIIYTAATYFDIKNGEQFPFLLFGDIRIFDDPLGRYCELCYSGDAPKVLSDKVSICAKDNIDIIEKCENRILVLPLRYMGSAKDESDFLKVGENVFLSMFPSIPDMKTYFKNCVQFEDLQNYIDENVAKRFILYDGDSSETKLEERLEKAIESSGDLLGEQYELKAGELFFFAVFGYIQQALDITLLFLKFGCIPLIRYSLAFQYVMALLPNFENSDNYEVKVRKTIVVNAIYRVFHTEDFLDISLAEYCDSIIKFDFENRAYGIYDECYNKGVSGEFMKHCISLIDEFKRFIRIKSADEGSEGANE